MGFSILVLAAIQVQCLVTRLTVPLLVAGWSRGPFTLRPRWRLGSGERCRPPSLRGCDEPGGRAGRAMRGVPPSRPPLRRRFQLKDVAYLRLPQAERPQVSHCLLRLPSSNESTVVALENSAC